MLSTAVGHQAGNGYFPDRAIRCDLYEAFLRSDIGKVPSQQQLPLRISRALLKSGGCDAKDSSGVGVVDGVPQSL